MPLDINADISDAHAAPVVVSALSKERNSSLLRKKFLFRVSDGCGEQWRTDDRAEVRSGLQSS